MAEVRYGIVFGEVNELFNGQMHRILTMLTLVSTGFTVTGASGVLQILTQMDKSFALTWTFCWLAIGVLAFAAQRAFNFKDKETRFKTAKNSFQHLEGLGWKIRSETLHKSLVNLRQNAPSGGDWLAPVAYNRACAELGYGDGEFQMDVPARASIAWKIAEWA